MAQTVPQKKDTWSATEYNNTASFVYSDAFIQPVLDLLQPHKNERIVDFGCGSGEVTRALMNVIGPSGLVLGLDSSKNMVSRDLFTHAPAIAKKDPYARSQGRERTGSHIVELWMCKALKNPHLKL